jgi:hypothetical protein
VFITNCLSSSVPAINLIKFKETCQNGTSFQFIVSVYFRNLKKVLNDFYWANDCLKIWLFWLRLVVLLLQLSCYLCIILRVLYMVSIWFSWGVCLRIWGSRWELTISLRWWLKLVEPFWSSLHRRSITWWIRHGISTPGWSLRSIYLWLRRHRLRYLSRRISWFLITQFTDYNYSIIWHTLHNFEHSQHLLIFITA